MKARIKATGEIVEVEDLYDVGTALVNGRYFKVSELDFLDNFETIDWEQRRYELAKSAIQGLISNSFWMKNLGMFLDEHPDSKIDVIETISIESINYADALIKKLKGK